jgi:hypothetical protein
MGYYMTIHTQAYDKIKSQEGKLISISKGYQPSDSHGALLSQETWRGRPHEFPENKSRLGKSLILLKNDYHKNLCFNCTLLASTES